MSTRRPLLATCLIFVIAFSILAFIQLEKNSLTSGASPASISRFRSDDQFGFLPFSTFSIQPALGVVKPSVLASATNSTRTEVFSFIVANPGIQFRGICAGLGIAIGTAEFHLGVLMKAGLISFVRDGKYKRFFATKKFSIREMKLISLLRHETVREIIKIIVDEKSISHCKLASELSITSQGLTWQMNRLREEGVIRETTVGLKVTYSLNKAEVQALPDLICMMDY